MKSHTLVSSLLLLVPLLVSSKAVLQKDSIVAPASIHIDSANKKKDKVVGMTPAQIRRAYGFDKVPNKGAGQTIAIIVAFDNPSIESDLAFFSETFGLPPCTVGNGCLEVVGNPPLPNPAHFPPALVELWQLEASLDIEWAHAIASQAKKVLVQAHTASLGDLLAAVDDAVYGGHDASVISMSWGLPETRDRRDDYRFIATNVSFVAASGDSGNAGLWPAASSDVTAVGGTKLNANSKGDYASEHSWADGGGGLSVFFPIATYQVPFTQKNLLGRRGLPDVSYHADPNNGFAVYSSTFGGTAGWLQVGGTSAGAPQWSAVIAIVNSMRKGSGKALLTGTNPLLYMAATTSPTAFNDISSGPLNGKNSACGSVCKVGPGYDYLTGLGSPKADILIPVLAGAP